jgi:hypothetical protein
MLCLHLPSAWAPTAAVPAGPHSCSAFALAKRVLLSEGHAFDAANRPIPLGSEEKREAVEKAATAWELYKIIECVRLRGEDGGGAGAGAAHTLGVCGVREGRAGAEQGACLGDRLCVCCSSLPCVSLCGAGPSPQSRLSPAFPPPLQEGLLGGGAAGQHRGAGHAAGGHAADTGAGAGAAPGRGVQHKNARHAAEVGAAPSGRGACGRGWGKGSACDGVWRACGKLLPLAGTLPGSSRARSSCMESRRAPASPARPLAPRAGTGGAPSTLSWRRRGSA